MCHRDQGQERSQPLESGVGLGSDLGEALLEIRFRLFQRRQCRVSSRESGRECRHSRITVCLGSIESDMRRVPFTGRLQRSWQIRAFDCLGSATTPSISMPTRVSCFLAAMR